VKTIIYLLFTIYYLLFTAPILAQTASNNSYNLNKSSISRPDEPTDQSTNQNSNLITGTNYQAILGFEDKNSKDFFQFWVSETDINYGEISPTDPVTRSNLLTVLAVPAYGYTIQSYEDHALKQETSQALIPDTTCDNGACNSVSSEPWNGNLTYGFGYRCDQVSSSNYCSGGFLDPTYFKQFAKGGSNQPQNIMQGGSLKKGQAQITYKVNISASQTPGFYSNSITYLAIPNF
jgi:hypothetical protein